MKNRKDRKVRVRFAPSPTGPLHLGGARTALFNWLFARSKGGSLILRIEDTDKERSRPEFEEDIKRGLNWLGLNWDEFYRQSERLAIYREHLTKLFNENRVYYCFCTKEELEAERQAMLAQGLAPKYSGRCRTLDKNEINRRLEKKESYVLRFKVPEIKVNFKDLIRGEITFDVSLLGDVIVAKDFDQPLYNFAVVVDDALSQITHVIRGEEHISNTPLQILLIKVFGFPLPRFAHLPLILNPERKKLSKRFADTALVDYLTKGYLKEAMVNFLAFLGWHPKEDKEIMSVEEIIEEFDLTRVQKGGAIFNLEKLDWLNGYYLRHLEFNEFRRRAQPFIPSEWQLTPAMVDSIKGRIGSLAELEDLARLFFELPDYNAGLLRWQETDLETTLNNLKQVRNFINDVSEKDFNQKFLEEKLLTETPRESRGEVLWPLRVALSGKEASPSPFEIAEALGKDEAIRRINLAVEKIKSITESR